MRRKRRAKRVDLSLPELALIAGTRGALGAGLGLLTSDRMGARTRKIAGRALLAVGVLSTIPLALDVFLRRLAPSRF